MTREKFKFKFPSLKELSQRTQLMFVNTDNAIDFPEPLQPNMIQVGGLQIVDAKPLPEASSSRLSFS
jgi:glucuronosyltransferase